MPLPLSIARFNKRYTDRFFIRLLRRTPGFTTVEHIGRHSGTAYRTPVYGFAAPDGRLLVSLTYGPSADWVQNVLANGATLHRFGRPARAIASANIVGRSAAWPHLPWPVQWATRALNVHDFVQLSPFGMLTA